MSRMVFQELRACNPHMTVRRANLAFGTAAEQDAESPKRERRVHACRQGPLGLEELFDRKPGCAVGRVKAAACRHGDGAIVREPKAFSWDEPLSNLDAMFARVDAFPRLARMQRATEDDDRVRHTRFRSRR